MTPENKDDDAPVQGKDVCDQCDQENDGTYLFSWQRSKGSYACVMFICKECV